MKETQAQNSNFKIYISYLQSDSAGHAGRLSDHLNRHFRNQNIVYDVNGIDVHTDWHSVIENQLNETQVTLIVIGRQWIDQINQNLSQQETDIVRFEVYNAVHRGGIIIPVLVHDAQMPSKEHLPTELQDLHQYEPFSIDDKTFARDVTRLARRIQASLGGQNSNEYSLPQYVIDLMLDYVDIRPDDTLYDPASGTGELLLSAYNRVRDMNNQLTRQTEFTGNFYGRNLNPETVEISRNRFRENRLNSQNIVQGNSLLQDQQGRLPRQFDVIITNTPFGNNASMRERRGFEYPSRYTEALFLQHAMQSLKQGGRCAMVLPIAFWIRSGKCDT